MGQNMLNNNQGKILNKQYKDSIIKQVLVIFLIIGLICSQTLWLSLRNVPLFPVISNIPLYLVSSPLDYILFLCSIVLLIIIMTVKSKFSSYCIIAFISLSVFWCICDQTRWQPWFYQYSLMLLAFVFDEPIITCRLIFPGIYIWSGIQKLNDGFVQHTYSWLMQPTKKITPEIFHFLFKPESSLAYAIPFIELLMGIGLIFSQTRKLSVINIIAMHIFILYSIGPFGHNWNSIVWPWNIGQIVFVFILYWNSCYSTTQEMIIEPLFKFPIYYSQFVFILIFILPILNLFDSWDSYLSFSLYSGRIPEGIFTIYESNKTLGNELSLQLLKHMNNNTNQLNLLCWFFNETNAPHLPEIRIYKTIGKYICEYMAEPGR